MKKIMMLAAATLVSASMLFAAEPETKMEKSFKEMFPNAKDVKWHKDDKCYLVSFVQGGTTTKIVYDSKGKFVQSLRYYSEKDLPTNILLAVKNKYRGKTIYGVTERTTADEVTYHIALLSNGMPKNVVAFSDGSIKDEATVSEEATEE